MIDLATLETLLAIKAVWVVASAMIFLTAVGVFWKVAQTRRDRVEGQDAQISNSKISAE